MRQMRNEFSLRREIGSTHKHTHVVDFRIDANLRETNKEGGGDVRES